MINFNDYDEGGLKMLNFKLFLDSLKLSWLKKLISPGKDTWKIIPLYILNKTHLGINILECKSWGGGHSNGKRGYQACP